MTARRIIRLVLTLAIGSGLAAPISAQAPDCSKLRSQTIVNHVQAALAGLPNLSGRVLIVHCGETLLDRPMGLADRANHVPVTAATSFDFGSLTKQFVAAAILRLRDRGKLALDDPLSRFIADLPRATGAITLHQLLTHTSGLPLYSGEDYDPQTLKTFLDWLRNVELDRPPGTRYSYSNPGYSVLAHIVELESGLNLEQFLRDQFFDRLDMDSTGYRHPEPPFAVNYLASGKSDGTPLEKAWRAEGPFWNLYGNGGMLSTVSDFQTWFRALRTGQVLSPGSTREMFTGHASDPENTEVGIGYGWRVIEDERGRWINHGGSNGASFFADVRYFEDSDAVMILSLNQFDLEQIRPLVRAFANAAAPAPADEPS